MIIENSPTTLFDHTQNMSSKSLRRNLLLWLLVPLIILFVASSAYTHIVTSPNIATRVYDRSLNDLAKTLAQQITFDNHGVPSFKLSDTALLILLSDDTDKVFFSVRNNKGQILAGNEKLSHITLDSHDRNQPVFFNSNIEGEEIRGISFNLYSSLQEKDNFVVIDVAETLNKRVRLQQEILSSTIFPQAMLILLATIAVLIGITKGLFPLRVLQSDLSQRSHLDLSPVNASLAPKEVSPIIHAINDLMGRLSLALGVQSRFAADAAHQLRTPLAGLKAQLELVSRQSTMEDMKKELKPLTISSDRMSRLVNQLLALACNDQESAHTRHFKPINLNTLVADTTREWVPEALNKKIDLGFTGDQSPATIFGDTERLHELIANLLDNAIRYTPEGGIVTAKVISHPPTLVVEDNGDGVPSEERQKVFERFYRVLGSRADGSGLGLSIVQEICLIHNAHIELDAPQNGKGTVVKIVFPMVDDHLAVPSSF